MPAIFSHPSYPVTDNYAVVGYNLIVSRAKGNTFSTAPVAAGAGVTITPASMTNISVGAVLYIDPQDPSVGEQVTVTAVTATTFTATFANNHGANFVIQSTIMSPNYFGPWLSIKTGYTSNLAVYDTEGSNMDLYRVAPIVQLSPGINPGPQIVLEYSRAFHPTTPLYDVQISSLMENLRLNYLDDAGVKSTDSTIPTESTGQGVMPFITDASTSRFYLSFIPNSDPIKFRETDVKVYAGTNAASATALVPYVDYFPNPIGGYIDFKTNPSASSYLRAEYTSFDYSDDECRSLLTNSVSELGLFGITDQTYAVQNSFNYYYLAQALPNRDVGQILCAISQKNALGGKIHSAFKGSEAWKLGRTEFTADPSRSIQAGTLWHTQLRDQIQQMANKYIINTRTYFSRGEYDSFFDNSGMLYPPFSVYNVFNYMSWWV